MKAVLKTLVEPFRPRLSPSFFIIGAQKAGTSALFTMLARHPDVLAPAVKEHSFFDNDAHYAKGIGAYLREFPLSPLRGGKVTFEATPDYLFFEAAPARLHAHFPNAPLVAVLRDPVKRAYSAWNMYRSFGPGSRYAHLHDPRPFVQAVEDELAGHTKEAAHLYLARGLYAEQVARYHRLFGKERLLVLSYKEFKSDPADVLRRVCSHVGLRPHVFGQEVLGARDNVRSYEAPLDAELAVRLYDWFAPHLAVLENRMGRPFDLDERKPSRQNGQKP